MTNYVGGYRLPSMMDAEGCERAMNEDVVKLGTPALFAERQRLLNAMAVTEKRKPKVFSRLFATPCGPARFSEWATERVRLINAELARR